MRQVECGPRRGRPAARCGHLALLKLLREADPDFVLLDGTLAACDRLGDGRADYSAKHRCHGVNVQAVTDRAVRPLRSPP